ncbi:hypothetical protein P691DRAFT_626444, partial [Macrolepiota fuliginosa MF-IS2]
YFDIINLLNYDVILGILFMYQHQVSMSLEPPMVVIGSLAAKPMKEEHITKLASRPMVVYEDKLDEVHQFLENYAQKICKMAMDIHLPPLWDINHEIPLIDEDKKYSWRVLKCPDQLCELWNKKRDAYIASGCWELCLAKNTVPMLLIMKQG